MLLLRDKEGVVHSSGGSLGVLSITDCEHDDSLVLYTQWEVEVVDGPTPITCFPCLAYRVIR